MPPRRGVSANPPGRNEEAAASPAHVDEIVPVAEDAPAPVVDIPAPDPVQLQIQLNALTDLVRQMAGTLERLDGKNPAPSLETAPPPPPVAVAAGNQEPGDQRNAGGENEAGATSRGRARRGPSGSSGIRRRMARRRAAEREMSSVHGPPREPLPRETPGDAPVPGGERMEQAGGDLRSQLNARRVLNREPEAPMSTEEARALMERVVGLEERLTGDVAGLRRDVSSQVGHLQRNLGQVAEVVNVDIAPARTHDHPFTAEIMRVPLPDKYKAPSIPPYDGRGDPDDHLELYTGHMLLHGYAEEIMCRAFRNHLTDSARRWFRTLRPNSIGGWNELREAFSLQFIGVKKYVPPKQNLTMVYQKPEESLRDWLARFGEAVAATSDVTDREALMGALSSMKKNSAFKRDLNRKPPSTYREFLGRAQGFINAEEAEVNDPERRQLRGKPGEKGSTRGRLDDSKRPDDRKRRNEGPPASTSRQTDHKRPRPEWTRKPRPPGRYDSYHELTVGLEEVYNQVGRSNIFRRPEPSRNPGTKGNPDKYCRFHGETGHDTNDCYSLRDEVERLIRDGRLQEFRAQGRHDTQRDVNRRQNSTQRDNTREPAGVIQTIHGGPYVGGDSRRSQKNYAHEARRVYQERFWNLTPSRPAKEPKTERTEISFSEADAVGVLFPHNDALVVEAVIGSHTVRRILIDNGSSVDILYSDCLNKMGISNVRLDRVAHPLYGFTGDSIIPEGSIRLPVTAGEKPQQTTVMANFVVVKGGSQYNAVIGRPTLQALKAVTSIYHQKVKFPTLDGVGEMKSNQYESRVAYSNAVHKPVRSESRQVYTVGWGAEGLDPRMGEDNPVTQPVEPLEELRVDGMDETKTVKIGSALPPEVKRQLADFLRANSDVFAWKPEDLVGVDPAVISHQLNVDPKHTPRRQKRRPMNPERYEALTEEVDKLIKNGYIRESRYPEWISNPVLVKKPNGTWRTCIDFTDLNKACPKDSFPLPRIDQLVDATAGHELLSFMDAYSGYNQIPMHPADEEHTTFITDRGLYCYRRMPFGLKNAGATYQRLVNKIFARQIGKTMEVYVDDMLVKSVKAADHTAHLGEMFDVLRQYKLKLNPQKCAFGVSSGKFLGFMVSYRGIEANPEKIQALHDMESPTTPKDVQKLTGCVAALNRFVSKATDKCVPFFDVLKGNKKFEWTPECESAFQKLKEHLGKPPLLSKPLPSEKLSLYLSVSRHAISSVLVREEGRVQLPVYYVSKRLQGAESRYPGMEKLALALVVTSRKLRHYFQAHTIHVLTNYPLRQVMQRPETSGRLLKWSVELSQFDIEYKPRTAIKGQALADFLTEFTNDQSCTEDISDEARSWALYVDGSANESGSGAGVMLVSPEGHNVVSSIRFGFKATNNEAEYEALLAGLRLAAHLKVERLTIFSDSQLVVSQVKEEYRALGERMEAYRRRAHRDLSKFKHWEIRQVPRAENSNADALAKLASSKDAGKLGVVAVEELEVPTIDVAETMEIEQGSEANWMTPITQYLQHGELPIDKAEARKLRFHSAKYSIVDGVLYRRGHSSPLQRCLNNCEAEVVLREIHEGVCGNHSAGRSLAFKVLRQGYYWPTLKKDAFQYARRCDKCQRYGVIPRLPSEDLNPVISPWPFAKWGIDLIGPLHTAPGGFKWAIVAVDYYTKWAEAKALTATTEAACTSFVWKDIICRFGVPHSIVSDNGRQFDNAAFKKFCDDLGIHKHFSAPIHPQANGQVEAVNKIIKYTLKKKLGELKGGWAEELPNVLWAYRTTSRSTTGETPFSLAFGMEAVLPIELETPTFRVSSYDEAHNGEGISAELDLLEERRIDSQLRLAAYQQRTARFYNKKVKQRRLRPGDLVLKRVTQSTKPKNTGPLGPSWEGPYRVREMLRPGTYLLENLAGRKLEHPWNIEQLKVYYQ